MKLPFVRSKREDGWPTFSYSVDGSDVVVSLAKSGTPVPVTDWMSSRPDAAGAIAEMHAASEDRRLSADNLPVVEFQDNSARLRSAFVAALDASAAASLGLPSPTSLALNLKPVGRIDEAGFHIVTQWVQPGGQPARARLEGALLTGIGGAKRLPEPLWSLYMAAQPLSEPLESGDRYRALAELRRHWPDDPRALIESDGYLQDLRVHYASSLSLKLRTLTPDRTDFDPVLFGGRTVQEAESEGRAVDEELDSVLTPAAQKLFAENRFRAEPSVRPVYVLRNGEYVVIDPALRPALDAVRKLQDRPEAERRAFVLNPRRVLRERLGEDASGSLGLDRLFIETEQFSARVAGVDVWRAPVLPWLTPSGKNNWIPERFGLRIGEEYYVLPPSNVSAVLERVLDAAHAGQPTASVPGLLESFNPGSALPPDSIPVNDQVIETMKSLEPFAAAAKPDAAGLSEEPVVWQAATQGKLFLVVRENLDEVEFAPAGLQSDNPEILEPVALPGRLRTSLKAHQIEGLDWLAACARASRPGALLADDMGLGKTLQAVAFMAWLQEEEMAGRRSAGPFLIVAPTGLLGTWRDEITKHLGEPRLGAIVPAFGSNLKLLREEDGFGARDIETGRAALRAESWRDAGVVLTTYETLRDYHFSFARTRFGLIVYDEIQKLKNPASQLARAAKALNADFTLGMTGTPVENRLQDLWSIMDVIAPGLLGSSRDFEKRHPADNPTALVGLKSQLTEPRDGRPPYMLRRLKADALKGMPAKHIHPFEIQMPPVQASAYRDLVVRAAASSAGGTMGKGGMLSTLARMRGVSLHPVDPRQAPADLDAYARDSARLSHTLTVLDGIAAKREKALIFVEDLAMQERLAGLIQARFKLPAQPMRINGSVPGQRRQQIVEEFQGAGHAFDVMILSPKAGGVGLTLTAANHVIHLSRWWNPAVEDQATDRVFRIGQTREVHVHLPLAVHPDPGIRETSFDLRLNALIERKRKLTRDLFLPPDASDGDLADLFREVSLGGEEPDEVGAESENGTTQSEPDLADDSTLRPVLSLPKMLVQSGIRQWRREAGERRPTEEIVGLFSGKEIQQVIIRDPYALARANSRQAQVRFLAELNRACRGLDAISIEYAPEAEGDVDETSARRDFGSIFSQSFPAGAPKVTLTRRNKRSRDDDFHDRFVEIDVRHAGGAVMRHEISIGRGVEALYDLSKQCTVTYAPPNG